MDKLSSNWITENHIDFEYKKYVLLAYLQHVNENFTENKLYPSLAELMTHYRNVMALRDSKKNFFDSIPERIASADFKNFKLVYEKILEDDKLMLEIESIISFSIPRFEKHIHEGKKIYDFIESSITVSGIGIIPLKVNEGYLFLSAKKKSETKVFEYQITLFENPDEKYRGICTHFLCSYEKTISNSYEKMKADLILSRKEFPNPATYVVETELSLPLDETFLPLAKRSLMKYVSTSL